MLIPTFSAAISSVTLCSLYNLRQALTLMTTSPILRSFSRRDPLPTSPSPVRRVSVLSPLAFSLNFKTTSLFYSQTMSSTFSYSSFAFFTIVTFAWSRFPFTCELCYSADTLVRSLAGFFAPFDCFWIDNPDILILSARISELL